MSFRNEFLIDGEVYTVEILSLNNEMVMMVNGTRYQISRPTTDASSILKINNNVYKTYSADTKSDVYLKVESETYHLEKKRNETAQSKDDQSANNINASMPGIVIEVVVKEGDRVKEGDVILSTESMKMQTNIIAPKDAVIGKLYFKRNETFEKGAVLASLEEM